MMEISQLQLILEWKMTKEEAFAFRLSLLYLELAKRYFPDYSHVRLPRKGDPRKSELFKYCWKLAEITRGRLALEEYRPYMQAQFTVLKNIQVGDYHPLIHPRCLVGKQAWKRWLLWTKHFNETKKISTPVEENVNYVPLVKQALKDTHFLLKLRLKEVTAEKLKEAMENKFLFRLIRLGGVSLYFVALSPTVLEYAKLNGIVWEDLPIHEQRITPEVVKFYKSLFGEV